MQKRRFVLFDFDGVIADSYDVAWATARILCKRITKEGYSEAFESNVHRAYDTLMSKEHGSDCNHDLDWFSVFTPAFEDGAKIFSGMVEVVGSLSHSYVLIIVSSTITSPIQGFLEKHRIGRYFSEVMGADVHISKSEKIKMVFEKYNVSASECVFVTDTLGDMREARAVGVGSLGVSWGFHLRETLEKGEPFRIADTPSQIVQYIADYFIFEGEAHNAGASRLSFEL